MYTLIKSVIDAGNYKLTDILNKIERSYIKNNITAQEADELTTLATTGISATAERPELLAMIVALAERVTALEAKLATAAIPEETPTGYPAWTPWDGISANYQYDAIVTHNGKVWQSKHNGQNVWEPGAAGTAALWIEYNA